MIIDITSYAGITSNSQKVKDNFIFVAIEGVSTDGHEYIEEAVKRGASLIVTQKKINLAVKTQLVRDTKSFFYTSYKKFYHISESDFSSVAVTGTNGKTTITYIIEHFLKKLGEKTLLCGTIAYRIGKELISTAINTTPGLEQFLSLLKLANDRGVKYLCMEVSSHALVQNRIGRFKFDVAIFSNLSSEHLDYHKNLENYFEAKRILFEHHLKDFGIAVINVDDKWGRFLTSRIKDRVKVLTVGQAGDLCIKGVSCNLNGTKIHFGFKGKIYSVQIPLIGYFNVTNCLLAVGALISLGFDLESLLPHFKDIIPPPGRLEKLVLSKRIVFIDYAHTPDALERTLNTLKRLTDKKRARLIVVFGCGGDRDKIKRPLMGKVADKICDLIVITSDNPRSEDPEDIINDILIGIEQVDFSRHIVEVDREKAIHIALNLAKEDDIILIAGKGHEDYQIIKDCKYNFSDKEVVLKWIEGSR